MIFAYAKDDRSLVTFRGEQEAIAYAEGVDVEDGTWLFFGEGGAMLEPVFTKPNERGRFTVRSGVYSFRPIVAPSSNDLLSLLSNVISFEGELCSAEAVRQVLAGGE